MSLDSKNLDRLWKGLLAKDIKTWVIFKHGTLVVCKDNEEDPREYAIH